MKKLYLLMLALLSCIVSANAQDFVVDGIWYSITNWDESSLEVEVIQKDGGYENDITIPDKIVPDKMYTVTGIRWDAFWECTKLTSVTIPNSVKTIGSSAFHGCTKLTSIEIPNSVTSIGSSAFHECTKLTSVTIPDGVTTIESSTFSSCTNLTSVTIPNSVTKIGNDAFSSCTSLTKITIPSSVTTIEGWAFNNCTSLSEITIPNSVEKIGNCTFQNCSNLKLVKSEIETPFEVNNAFDWSARENTTLVVPVGKRADYKGTDGWKDFAATLEEGEKQYATEKTDPQGIIYKLRQKDDYSVYYTVSSHTEDLVAEIEIPADIDGCPVETIEQGAFYSCANLTKITIPNSVKSIGNDAFGQCNNIKVVTSKLETPLDMDSNVFGWWYNNATLVVPKGKIAAYKEKEAWKYFGFTIEEGEKVYAWEQTDLQGINYKLMQTENYDVYYSVMGHTDALSAEIVIPADIDGCPVKTIEQSAFYNCSNLTSVILGDNITTIGWSAFYECTGLKSIIIPNSVTSIGNEAFYNCNITSITFYNDVEDIASNAFNNCTSLKDLNVIVTDDAKFCNNHILGAFENPMRSWDSNWNEVLTYITIHLLDKEGTDITDYIVPEGVKTIGENAFKGYTKLSSITLPNNVTSIGKFAFLECSGLSSVTLGDGLTTIEEGAFRNCTSLSSVEIPNSLTSIGAAAFEGCSDLFEIHIPNSVTSVGKDAFQECSNLSSVTFSNKLTTIEDGVFQNCTGLTSITIPNSVTSIGANAFSGCSNISIFNMGKSVSSIGDNAFYNCTSLISITLPKNLESIGNSAFSCANNDWWSSDNDEYVPITSITIPSNVKTIGNYAFAGCRALAAVNFEVDHEGKSSLTSIGDAAFRKCSFTSITIPNSVTTLGSSAFAYNSSLATAILGNDLTEIKDRTFESCSGLTSVTIPDGVTNIGQGAFQSCSQLKSVKLPTSLTSMGEEVFNGCQMKSIELPNSFTDITDNLFKNNDFEYIKLGNNVKSIGKFAFGSNPYTMDGEDAQVVIEIGTSTPPKVDSKAFPELKDEKKNFLGIITVIVPDAAAETAYRKAAMWKDMTYANMTNDVVVTVSPDSVGLLSSVLVRQCPGMMPSNVVGMKIKGTIDAEDFNQMRVNYKALLRLDLSDCDITDIPDGAMTGATQLQELTLPTKLQTIGRNAFQGCTYLTGKLNLPTGVTSIGNSAFEGTYYTSVALPKSLKTIGDSAFFNLPIKQTLNLPEGLTSIGKYAFADTQVYDDIVFPHSIDELGDGAFRNTQISDVALPTKITSLSREVFQGCSNIDHILDILENYTEVGGYAFDGCSSIKSLRLSSNLSRMGEYAFQNTSIKYVNIPDRVKVLANGVFKNCQDLESLALPANLEKVSSEALYGCSGLRNMSVEAIEPPTVESSSMLGINTDLCIISIPTKSHDKYLLAKYWGRFVNQRNDIAVETEGNGDIAFQSVEGGEEEEAMARARARQIMHARARTRGTTEAETELMYVNSGSSVYVPKEEDGTGKVRFFILPRDGEKIEKATLDGVDITNDIVDGVYTATAKQANGQLIVIFSGKAEEEVITTPIKIGDKGKTTLTSSEALDFSGFTDLKAYVATGYEGNGTIWLTRITQVPANTPILVKGAASEIYNVPVMDKCDAYYENLFVGSAEEDIYIWSTSYEDGMSYRNYYMAGGVFKPVSDSKQQTIKAGKCYLRVPYWFDGNYTGDSQTFTMSKSGKSSYTPPVAIDVTDLEAQGLKAYTATGYDAATSTIWLTRINKIPAGTGVILKGDKEKTYTLPSVNVEAYYGNMFIGNTYGTITINETSDDGEWTNFYLASGSFKKVNGTREIGDFKSYLHLPTSLLVSGTRGKSSAIADEWSMEELETEIMILGSIGGDDEDGTTKIDAIGNESAQPDVYYNLQGQRVDNPGKGVYIRNGKKVIIK